MLQALKVAQICLLSAAISANMNQLLQILSLMNCVISDNWADFERNQCRGGIGHMSDFLLAV